MLGFGHRDLELERVPTLAVRLTSMPDCDYINYRVAFENTVDDSIVTAAYTKQIV